MTIRKLTEMSDDLLAAVEKNSPGTNSDSTVLKALALVEIAKSLAVISETTSWNLSRLAGAVVDGAVNVRNKEVFAFRKEA